MKQSLKYLLYGISLCMAAVMLLFAVMGLRSDPVDAATVAMKTSDAGVSLLKQFEGFRLTAYKAAETETYWTIGYGHYGADVYEGMKITQEEAEALLKKDLVVYENSVNNFVNTYNISLNQNQFDALVCFTYNVGQNKWTNGSVFRLRDYLVNGISNYTNYEITTAFTSFNTSGGTVLKGLTRRRKMEAALFLGNPSIAAYGPGRYQVNNSAGLNVRSGPGTTYSIAGFLNDGTQMDVTSVEYVSVNGVSSYWGKCSGGWISLDYCECVYGFLDTPVLSGVSNTGSGVNLTWKPVANAAVYQVYVKGSGGWTRIGQTTGTSYTYTKGITSGTSYTFTVRCITSDQKYFESDYDKNGISITYIATPKLTAVSGAANGVTVSWEALKGAEKYRVFRKVSGGSWVRLADTTGTSYTDTTAVSGTSYTYTVRCINSGGTEYTSGYESGLTILYAGTPKLSSVNGVSNGVTITWAKAAGAVKYRVFRKVSGGSWVKIGDTTGTSYTDTTAATGTSYIYTVRCMNSGATAYTGGYETAGISILYAATPHISSVENVTNGVTIKWASAKGAAKYRVFRKVSGGSWVRLADTTGTSYTDTTAVSGTSYTYTVRCINSGATAYTSGYESGLTTLYVATPKLSSVTGESGGVTITWAVSKGAVKYRVFRKVSGGSWVKLGDTTGTSYTDKTAAAGTNYTYTVRCINSGATAYTSSYESGLTILYAATPKLSSVTGTSGGVTVSWTAAKGAAKYRVFRKVSGGSWVRLADTTGTSYTDATAVAGTNYTYTVRCINSGGTAYTSGYESGGTILYAATPKLGTVTGASGGVTVTWAAAKGAAKYRVFRKVSGGSWVRLADTTGTSYTDTSVTAGTNYTYTVRCINSGLTAYTSGYESGLTILYAATPKLSSATGASGRVTITWAAAKGAAKYRVFRKVSGGSWVKLADTTETSYKDTTGVNGTSYIYTVRCINREGTMYTGGYETGGISCVYKK